MKFRKIIPYVFILPALLWHFLVVAVPSLATFGLAFTEWNGLASPEFIGFDNFIEIFTEDDDIGPAILNNLKWIGVFLTVPIILGLIMAVLVSKLRRSQMFFRTVLFLPYVLSAAIAGKIWTAYLNPYFGISNVFRAIGLDGLADVLWLGDPDLAIFTVAFVDNWHWWGFIMVLFIGALQQVDTSLYEAVRVEGGNFLHEFFNVTIPGILPTFVFVIITTIMWSFLAFDYVWVMTMGGPNGATDIISTVIYKNAFISYRAGYANAISVIQAGLSLSAYFIMVFMRKKGWDV